MQQKKIGEYIALKRKKLKLTQDELGEKLGVTGKAVSKWERGISVPDIDNVRNLASVLMCRTDNILNGSEDAVCSSDKNSVIPDYEAKSNIDNTNYIELSDKGYIVSPLLFGGNIEHTRSAIFGGLSAQMLRNRKFAGVPGSFRGNAENWFIIGDKTYGMVGNDRTYSGNVSEEPSSTAYTCHSPIGYHMKRRFECNSQLIQSFSNNGVWGIGQHSLYIESGCEYEFRIVLQTDAKLALTVSLTSRDSTVCYATESIEISSDSWNAYTVILKSKATEREADLRITFTESAKIVIGAVSLMPADNFYGMRNDVVEALKECNLKFLRWPGGNFAGEYNWLDGLLPCDMRAPIESHNHYLTQPHTMGYDFSEINTDDFIMLCRKIGAIPSITINVTWNTPEENAAWVEYCNGDENTKFGRMRIERGFKEPFNVKYWSIGNEAGYGHMEGDNTPQGYLRIAKENADAMLKTDPTVILCSSGYHPNPEWEEVCNKLSSRAPMAALHNYVNFPKYVNIYDRKSDYEKYIKGVEICRDRIHVMRENLSKDVSIAFDEWNCWYSWHRPRDAFAGIFAARMFNMFIIEQKASNVSTSASYQPINEGCICVLPNKCELTPMGDAHSVMSMHSNGRVLHSSDNVAVTQKDGIVTITIVNDSYDTQKDFIIKANGEIISSKCYYAESIGPFSEFKNKTPTIQKQSDKIRVITPPLSITAIQTVL